MMRSLVSMNRVPKTGVAIAKAAPGGPIEFTMDRPFIFLIRDIETNTVLFMGRVVNPLD